MKKWNIGAGTGVIFSNCRFYFPRLGQPLLCPKESNWYALRARMKRCGVFYGISAGIFGGSDRRCAAEKGGTRVEDTKRMMSPEAMDALLQRAPAGTLSMVGTDGSPYAVPVHFVQMQGKIYVHSRPTGQKITALGSHAQVCFNVYQIRGYVYGKTSCNTNTKYESVLIKGIAKRLEDSGEKERILHAFVEKYVPERARAPLPQQAIMRTCVIEVVPLSCSSKCYEGS